MNSPPLAYAEVAISSFVEQSLEAVWSPNLIGFSIDDGAPEFEGRREEVSNPQRQAITLNSAWLLLQDVTNGALFC
jgi:hypothetical protein